MRVVIQFKGPIAQRIERGLVEITVDEGSTISSVLVKTIEREPYLQSIWRESSEIDRDSMILCNGIDIGVLGGLEMKMNEEDTLTILPLVHGG